MLCTNGAIGLAVDDGDQAFDVGALGLMEIFECAVLCGTVRSARRSLQEELEALQFIFEDEGFRFDLFKGIEENHSF